MCKHKINATLYEMCEQIIYKTNLSILFIFLLLPTHCGKELNLVSYRTHVMFGIVGDIQLQRRQPTFISITRKKA